MTENLSFDLIYVNRMPITIEYLTSYMNTEIITN